MSSTSTMRQPYSRILLALVWPKPTDRIPVYCSRGWTSRRLQRVATDALVGAALARLGRI